MLYRGSIATIQKASIARGSVGRDNPSSPDVLRFVKTMHSWNFFHIVEDEQTLKLTSMGFMMSSMDQRVTEVIYHQYGLEELGDQTEAGRWLPVYTLQGLDKSDSYDTLTYTDMVIKIFPAFVQILWRSKPQIWQQFKKPILENLRIIKPMRKC